LLGDFRIDELAAQRFEAFERAFLVRPISREYPVTSAARIAARRRVWLTVAPAFRSFLARGLGGTVGAPDGCRRVQSLAMMPMV
jgi:hypothetical protein